MTRVIGIANQKGGTGKSTTAINLGSLLVAMGRRVLLIDLDPQANATLGLGFGERDIKQSIYNVLAGEIYPEEAIKRTRLFGFDIIPSDANLAGATVELVNMKNREFLLRNAIKRLTGHYDYILIDCPPSLGLLTVNGVVASEEIIVPVQCEYYALEGLSQLLKTIKLVSENLESEVTNTMALLTMYDKRNKLDRNIAKEVRRNFSGYIFETVIPRNISLAEAPSHGKTILQFAPYSYGAKAYRQLAAELIKLES